MGRGGGLGLGRGVIGAALALGGCAVIGPDYVKPAAIVPAQYKEVKGWKLAQPRDDYAKGAWWDAFHDPLLNTLEAPVSISNQTLKADEANYREAQALIAEARAQLFPTLTFNGAGERGNTTGGAVLTALSLEANASWTPDI